VLRMHYAYFSTSGECFLRGNVFVGLLPTFPSRIYMAFLQREEILL